MDSNSYVHSLKDSTFFFMNQIWLKLVSKRIHFDVVRARKVRRFDMSCRQESSLEFMIAGCRPTQAAALAGPQNMFYDA